MVKNVIEIAAVNRRFGDVHAVQDVDLAVHEGEVFGLIGHNGAGKSTLIKMMLGLLEPDSGSIKIDGESVHGQHFRDVRRRIAYLPENVVFYDNLSGLETLRFIAELKGANLGDCPALLRKVGLSKAASRPVRGYSKGMRQRLGFAQALLGEPRILFLDEPTTGLDPEGIRSFYSLLGELKQRGVTTLLSSHHLAEIEERIDRLAVMKMGRVQAIGTVQALREDLDLPLRIEVAVLNGREPALEQLLKKFEGAEWRIDGGMAFIRCDRRAKIPLVHALTGLSESIGDLHVREPSLEDVFLGYRNL